MKSKAKNGSLFSLLIRNYLLFTLVLILIATGVYAAWNESVYKAYAPTDWDKVTDGIYSADGEWNRLTRYLSGDGTAFAVLDEEGEVLYSSSENFKADFTPGELECITQYRANYYVESVDFTGEDGKLRHMVTKTEYDDEGEHNEYLMLLDENYNVLNGGFGDGKTTYTQKEFEYLTENAKGYNIYRFTYYNADGDGRIVVMRDSGPSDEGFARAYSLSKLIWLLIIPLYIAAMGLFIWWLDRRIRRPLDRLNGAIVDRSMGGNARVGDCGGPKEIQRIGESFDMLSDKLEQSEAERRRLDEGRQKLIADISHDIKTPITVITGYADAICDGKIAPEETEHYLRAIRGKAENLTELVNAFHEYSKTEHPDFELNSVRTDVCEYIREYFAQKYDEIDIAGFNLEVDIPEKPIYCMIDSFEFKRVLDNLLSNSLRHNRLGTVLFCAVEPQKYTVEIKIGDNGTGIPQEREKNIFEPFVMGDESRSGGGSGLGLSITRRIVEKHGGTIELSANPTRGRSTEFVVILPRKK